MPAVHNDLQKASFDHPTVRGATWCVSDDNPTMADAILDRLVSGIQWIALENASMRKLRGRGKGALGQSLTELPVPSCRSDGLILERMGGDLEIGGWFMVIIGGESASILDVAFHWNPHLAAR